jgi:hypothetical protein
VTASDHGDGFDALAQRLAVALRDHADATRALPDLDAMRATLEVACRVAPATSEVHAGSAARPPARVLAAAACSLLVLGGLGVVAARGDGGSGAPTFVADESLLAEARRASAAVLDIAPPSTATVPAPAPTVAEVEVASSGAPVPSTTAVPPPTTSLIVVVVSNDLQIAPTTTEAPPPPVTAPPSTEPAPPTPEVPAPTTTATPPKPTIVRTTTTASPYAFTVKQRWKTSSASPPFEEFSGTAQPGATITISSSYGGGTAVAGPTGAWAARVEFPTAPVGTKFTGKVKTAQGQKSFTFTRTSA